MCPELATLTAKEKEGVALPRASMPTFSFNPHYTPGNMYRVTWREKVWNAKPFKPRGRVQPGSRVGVMSVYCLRPLLSPICDSSSPEPSSYSTGHTLPLPFLLGHLPATLFCLMTPSTLSFLIQHLTCSALPNPLTSQSTYSSWSWTGSPLNSCCPHLDRFTLTRVSKLLTPRHGHSLPFPQAASPSTPWECRPNLPAALCDGGTVPWPSYHPW